MTDTRCISNLLVMILIIISFDYVGSVHSTKPKFTDVDSKKEENYEEGDKGKKSLDKSEEAHF